MIVHFLLRFAVHDERDRLVEFELWTAIERDEFLALNVEFNCQDRSWRLPRGFGSFFAVAENSSRLRILENGRVKLHCLLGLMIEPQEWSDFLHSLLTLCCCGRVLFEFRNSGIHL